MNSLQRRYALERLEQIAKAKRAAAKKLYDTTKLVITGEALAKALASGEVVVKATHRDREISQHSYLHDVLSVGDADDAKAAGHAAFCRDLDVINAEVLRLKDRIMLGDAEEALQLLATFEAL